MTHQLGIQMVCGGGALRHGAMQNGLYRGAVSHVSMILKRVRPADLRVEQATHFALGINLKAAKTLAAQESETGDAAN